MRNLGALKFLLDFFQSNNISIKLLKDETQSISNISNWLRSIWIFQINIKFGFMLKVIFITAKETLNLFAVFLLLIIATAAAVGGLVYVKDTSDMARQYVNYFIYTYKLTLGDFGDFFLFQGENDIIKSKALSMCFSL